jgi:hypothetical protein
LDVGPFVRHSLIRRFAGAVSAGALAIGLVLATAPAPAAADVIVPAAGCFVSGQWQTEGTPKTSPEFLPDDTITIPRADTVKWTGNEKGFRLTDTGPKRVISGEVVVDLPIGSITVDSWGGESVKYANEGLRPYDLPAILGGVKMRLHGEHRDDGLVACSGSVNVKVAGSALTNPMTYVALGLLLMSGAGLVGAGRQLPRPAAGPSPGFGGYTRR